DLPAPRHPRVGRAGRHQPGGPLQIPLPRGGSAEGRHAAMARQTKETSAAMRINLTSVYVDDQDKALKFYTDVLGFVKKTEIPLGEARWLTVVASDQPDGPELVLEPDSHPAAR